ncbi:TIGR01244 family phosphatase [Xanthomonas phaseoli pv. phaseoli]|uniref:TIGR01244 family sulfur transferase n=1 Tax=Xanthomonas phaseoli TaxID=1985254 RepID=UPI00062B3BDE|nr:TIGR01244 family sulfur transferase [Xanthomonas phaseoli]KKY08460.1 hypothetical protein ST27_23640 [Xanthomonas phaseoli pv. phaseoli]QWN29078.1 TIGR01244 family phosphatase [Xanthomonas phaseoli pv. phaseoli]
MKLRSLTPALLVTSQLLPADLPALASLGVASVICNRPHNEQPDQPDHLPMQSACTQAGMRFAYLPVVAGAISQDDVQQFCDVVEQLPAPVAAYCRTGTRSTSIRAPELAAEVNRIGWEGGLQRVRMAILDGPDQPADPSALASQFVDLVFAPHQLRALLGEHPARLVDSAADRVEWALGLLSAAGQLKTKRPR